MAVEMSEQTIPERPNLSVDEIAEELHVSRNAIRNAILSGKLRATRVGRMYRLKRSDVESYLEAQAVKPPTAEEKK